MKADNLSNKDRWKKGGYARALRHEAGYVLPWVLIMALVAGLIIGPFLMFMLNGVSASYSYADTMAEFYAADSGVEDAISKIRHDNAGLPQTPGDVWSYDFTDNVYDPSDINGKQVGVDIERLWILDGLEGTAVLSGGISAAAMAIPVDDTAGFPESGVLCIEDELIEYEDVDEGDSEFVVASGGRGYGGTTAAAHSTGAAVSLESVPALPTGLTVVGQIVEGSVTTTLSADIDDDDTVIPLASIDDFPLASEELPALIRIDDELIQYQYVDRDNDELVVFDDANTPDLDGRGVRGTTPADHDMDATVTAWSATYQVDFTYDDSYGDLYVDRLGVWLPPGISYVPGSSNVATALDDPMSDGSSTVSVLSTALFPGAAPDDLQVIAIEDELIQYEEKDDSDNEFDVASGGRGYRDTEAAAHSIDTLVTAEPCQVEYRGGIALEWNIDPVVNFTSLQTLAPAGEGDWQPGAEFPFRRTLTFRLSPAQSPKGIFAWIRTTNLSASLFWDGGSATYKITATATDPSTGTQTSLESYVGTSKLTDRITQVYGDAIAIGNSLMIDDGGSAFIRETPLAESSASVPADAIPDDAEMEVAYLYWSGWQSEPDDISSIVDSEGNILDQEDFEDLVDEVNEADFTIDFEGAGEITYPVTAEKVQVLNNGCGWSFSSFKDVTSLFNFEQTATITLVAGTDIDTESVIITNTDWWWSDPLNVEITVLSGPDGGYVTVDGEAIDVGDDEDFSIADSAELTSGGVDGTYTVRIEVTGWDYGEVDGTAIDGDWWTPTPDSIDVTLTTTVTTIPPLATITKVSSSSAEVDITNVTPNEPPDSANNITADDDPVLPGETKSYGPYFTDTPHEIEGVADDRQYQVTITCTSGTIVVTNGANTFPLSAGPIESIPEDYTVGNVNADPGDEGDLNAGQWAYAGWSLIMIYSDPSPDAEPHRVFLYDKFLHAPISSTHYFTLSGFQSPADSEGSFLTCFVGEGDWNYEDDFIEFRAEHDSGINWNTSNHVKGPLNLENSESPWDNVWNGQSPGFEGLAHNGIDIDTFDISDRLEAGDTSADIRIKTWELENLVYIFVSVPSVASGEGGGTSLGVITYNYGGE
jgi:hypothetical protein